MTSIIIPKNKPWPATDWYVAQLDGFGVPLTQPCPAPLLIGIDAGYFPRILFNFNGRGWDSFGAWGCPYTETYEVDASGTQGLDFKAPSGVSYSSRFGLDVWQAYADGIWTSSCTVALHVTTFPLLSPATISLWAHPRSDATNAVNKTFTSSDASCGSVTSATVTINDDGTYSIA